jgi:hypothetical protein
MRSRTEALTELILGSDEVAALRKSLEECLHYVWVYESEHMSSTALDIGYRAKKILAETAPPCIDRNVAEKDE